MRGQMLSPAKWETDIDNTLEEAALTVPSSGSPFDELVLAYLDFCHTHKDMTKQSILQRYI